MNTNQIFETLDIHNFFTGQVNSNLERNRSFRLKDWFYLCLNNNWALVLIDEHSISATIHVCFVSPKQKKIYTMTWRASQLSRKLMTWDDLWWVPCYFWGFLIPPESCQQRHSVNLQQKGTRNICDDACIYYSYLSFWPVVLGFSPLQKITEF